MTGTLSHMSFSLTVPIQHLKWSLAPQLLVFFLVAAVGFLNCRSYSYYLLFDTSFYLSISSVSLQWTQMNSFFPMVSNLVCPDFSISIWIKTCYCQFESRNSLVLLTLTAQISLSLRRRRLSDLTSCRSPPVWSFGMSTIIHGFWYKWGTYHVGYLLKLEESATLNEAKGGPVPYAERMRQLKAAQADQEARLRY